MSKLLNPLRRIEKFCLSLPGSTVVVQFGHPFFKWREKPFCIFSNHGTDELSIKVEKQSQPVFLSDPRFRKTPYLGHHGWVTLTLDEPLDWNEIEELIQGSYDFVSTPKPKAKKKQK